MIDSFVLHTSLHAISSRDKSSPIHLIVMHSTHTVYRHILTTLIDMVCIQQIDAASGQGQGLAQEGTTAEGGGDKGEDEVVDGSDNGGGAGNWSVRARYDITHPTLSTTEPHALSSPLNPPSQSTPNLSSHSIIYQPHLSTHSTIYQPHLSTHSIISQPHLSTHSTIYHPQVRHLSSPVRGVAKGGRTHAKAMPGPRPIRQR